jgi:hypothetical protein
VVRSTRTELSPSGRFRRRVCVFPYAACPTHGSDRIFGDAFAPPSSYSYVLHAKPNAVHMCKTKRDWQAAAAAALAHWQKLLLWGVNCATRAMARVRTGSWFAEWEGFQANCSWALLAILLLSLALLDPERIGSCPVRAAGSTRVS